MFSMQEWLNQYLATRRETYRKDPPVCISFYKEELQRKQEYNGRQILELIQNAEDESPDEGGEIEIWLSHNKLVVANNGAPFSQQGVRSLMTPNVSAKLKDSTKIGSKGLGFRSLLNWSNKIEIVSKDLSIEFSRTAAIEFLESVYSQTPEVKTEHESILSDEYPIATLAAPKWKEVDRSSYIAYTTYVTIFFDEQVIYQDISQQLNGIDSVELLFLRKLKKITLHVGESTRTIQKNSIRKDAGYVNISVEKDGKGISQNTWRLFTRDGSIPEAMRETRSSPYLFELKIALTDTLNDRVNNLFSYFKTKVHFSFPALLHGTFELSGDRNSIVNTAINQLLMEELIQLLIDTAKELSKMEVSWKPLQLLAFDEATYKSLSEFDFEAKLTAKIRESELYPTIYNRYISYDSQPVFYDNAFQSLIDYTKYGIFENMLQRTQDFKIKQFCSDNAFVYNKAFIKSEIEKIQDRMPIQDRVKIILYANDDLLFPNPPSILFDSNNSPITREDEIFSTPELDWQLPGYVKLRFLSEKIINEIKRQKGLRRNRDVLPFISKYNVKEYSFETIFRKALSIEHYLRNRSEESEKGKFMTELMRSLFDFYNTQKKKLPSLHDIKIHLPNRIGIFSDSKTLYFGKDYGEDLTEELFTNFGETFLVAPVAMLGLNQSQESKEFLSWLGVSERPSLVNITKNRPTDEYVEEMCRKIKFPIVSSVYSYLYKSKAEILNTWGRELRTQSIEHLEEILANADSEVILTWIISDGSFTSRLLKNNDKNTQYFFGQSYKQSKDSFSIDCPPYIGFLLAYTPWLRTAKGENAKPVDCILLENSIGLESIVQVPSVNYLHDEFRKKQISRERIDVTLHEIGVKKDFSMLTPSQLYELLYLLPQVDPAGENAKHLYRLAHKALDRETLEESDPARVKFMKEGKVLVRKGDHKYYAQVEEAYYVDNTVFCKSITHQIPVFELDRRKGNQKVKQLFGVKPIENVQFRLTALPIFHALNIDFKTDLESFKMFFYSKRIDKDTNLAELRLLKKLNVHLVREIGSEFSLDGANWQTLYLNQYEYVTLPGETTEVFIFVPGDFAWLNELKDDMKFGESISNIISNQIRLETDEDFTLLYSKPDKGRMQWLDLKFGGADEIFGKIQGKFNSEDELKFLFWKPIAIHLSGVTEFTNFEAVRELLLKSFGSEKFDELTHVINYAFINDRANFGALRVIFKTVNISIKQYNEFGSLYVDFTKYLQEQLKLSHEAIEEKFQKHLFKSLQAASVEVKATYFEEIQKFSYKGNFKVENDLEFLIDEELNRWLVQEFNLSLQAVNAERDEEPQWLTKLFSAQLANFKTKNKSIDNANFLNDWKIKSLILFGELKHVENQWALFTEKTILPAAMPTRENPEDLFNRIRSAVQSGKLKSGKVSTRGTIAKNGSPSKMRHKASYRPFNQRQVTDERKLQIGEQGELFAFHFLNECEWATDVKWLSATAQKFGQVIIGNDALGYDMTYRDKTTGETRYVEVKCSTGNQIEFMLTSNEFQTGNFYKESYRVFFIAEVENDESTIYALDSLFSERTNFFDNPNFVVESDSYVISYGGDISPLSKSV